MTIQDIHELLLMFLYEQSYNMFFDRRAQLESQLSWARSRGENVNNNEQKLLF